MKTQFRLLGILCLLCAAPAALAQSAPVEMSAGDPHPEWTLGLSAGTFGIGPEATWRPNRYLGLRGSFTAFPAIGFTISGFPEYEGDAHLLSGGLMADFHPRGRGFRVSGGFRVNGTTADLVGTIDRRLCVPGACFTPEQTGQLLGDVEARTFSPVVSVGYVSRVSPRLVLGIEAGAMFQKLDVVNFDLTTDLDKLPIIAALIAQEREGLEERLEDFEVWPVLQLTVSYAF